MYKVNHGMVPSNVNATFSVQSSKYHLRNKDSHIPKFNTVHYGKHSMFGPYLSYIWCRLDSKVKDKPSIRRINLVDLISDNCGSCIIIL